MQDADDKKPELESVRLLATAFENNGNYYELQIINSMVEEDDLAEELLREALILYFILILSIIIINNFILKRLWKPFYSFLEQLKNYRIGNDKKFPASATNTKEFTDLQNAVHILLQHNRETYEQQKQFIGNAAHELQTPLAIATNKLELLIEKGDLQNEQAENIAEIMSITERLIRLNKSLLLLTKIENKQFLENQTVSFNEIVKQNINDWQEISDFKKIKISVEEKTELTVKMDISLANIVVSNLLRNAIFHNILNGDIHIEIAQNTFQISNTGIKDALNDTKVFSRFYKSESNQSGTGLGLAIVKAVCDLYHFPVSYQFKNGLHHFQILFFQ